MPRLSDTEGASKQGRGSSSFLRPATGRVVLMRRMMLVVTAALVMAAMMVAMAMPAFAVANEENANPDCTYHSTTTCYEGQFVASSTVFYHDNHEKSLKHYHKMFECFR